MSKNYDKLLNYFKVFYDEGLPTTCSYVVMDDIHNSIVDLGVDFKQPLKYYIIKAKQYAMRRFKRKKKELEIIQTKPVRLITKLEENVIDHYGFTLLEKVLIRERLKRIGFKESTIKKDKYYKILLEVKKKLKDMSPPL